MTIFSEFGSPGSRPTLVNARLVNTGAFALEQLVSIHCVTSDLRWAMIELAWRSFTAMCGFAQGRLLSWGRGHHTPREEEGGGHCCC